MSKEEVTKVVGRAIQDLAAVRLGRGFIPLALIFLLGLGRMLARSGGFLLAAGAPLSAGAMLAFGLQVVQRAFGRRPRPWMVVAAAAGLVPPVFGVYVLGWEGLRGVAQASGFASAASGVLLSVLGAWVLRVWIQLLELRRLADTMTLGALHDAGDDE